MVDFGGRYDIDPAQVEYTRTADREGEIVADSHLYDLTAHLLSDKSLGICYTTKVVRKQLEKMLGFQPEE